MTPIAPLVPEGEAAWLRVKQHLQWCDSFALVFVFSDQPAVADCLRERLADVYRARITRLEVPMPRSPEALFEDLLPRLLHPPPYQLALNAPLWLDLARPPPEARIPWRSRSGARPDFSSWPGSTSSASPCVGP